MPPKKKLKPDKGQHKVRFLVSAVHSQEATQSSDSQTALYFAVSSWTLSSTATAEAPDQLSSGSKETLKVRHFQEGWNIKFPWMIYDETSEKMLCTLCKEYEKYSIL